MLSAKIYLYGVLIKYKLVGNHRRRGRTDSGCRVVVAIVVGFTAGRVCVPGYYTRRDFVFINPTGYVTRAISTYSS